MKKRSDIVIGMIASLRLTVICLLLFFVLTILGTIYQVHHGLFAAQQRFFDSWIFPVFRVVPFPGGQLVMTVLFVNLLFSLLFRLKLGWRYLGLALIHLGLLTLLVGGFVSHYFSQESLLTLGEGDSSSVALTRTGEKVMLPVTLRLLNFKKEFYPNSEIPKNFSSRIEVDLQGVPREVEISMNRPFRYKGYAFYQESYIDAASGREVSTLAVTKNYGRLIPYMATVVTSLGLIVHFLIGMLRRGQPTRDA